MVGEPYEHPRTEYSWPRVWILTHNHCHQKTPKTKTKTKRQAKNPFILVLKTLENNLRASISSYVPLIMRTVANSKKPPWLHTELFLTLQGAHYDFPAISRAAICI